MQTLGEAHQRISGDIIEFDQEMAVLHTGDNDADKSAALQDHFTLWEQCQTESQRRGTGATILIDYQRS